MSNAPDVLIELRRYLAAAMNLPRASFGIRSLGVTNRRPWGYHLGYSEIYGVDGMGDRDYSVRRRRDQRSAGLQYGANVSAGFDVGGQVSQSQLQEQREHLLGLARSGNAPDLVEILGPGGLDGVTRPGRAYRWAKPSWRPTILDEGNGHEHHNHYSFHRDSLGRSKLALFVGLYGPIDPLPPDPPDPEPEPEPEPPDPSADRIAELEAAMDQAITILTDALEADQAPIE